jgi:hypothetical protein
LAYPSTLRTSEVHGVISQKTVSYLALTTDIGSLFLFRAFFQVAAVSQTYTRNSCEDCRSQLGENDAVFIQLTFAVSSSVSNITLKEDTITSYEKIMEVLMKITK